MSSAQCERSHSWICLQLDGMLSEFESLLLDRHLVSCPACRTFAADVDAHTRLLRTAPAVPPRIAIELPLTPARRRTLVTTLGTVAAAAAAVVLAIRPVPLTQQPARIATNVVRPSGLTLVSFAGDSLGVRKRSTQAQNPDGNLVRGSFGLPA